MQFVNNTCVEDEPDEFTQKPSNFDPFVSGQ